MKYTNHDIVVIQQIYDCIFILNGRFSNNCLASNDIFHAIKTFWAKKSNFPLNMAQDRHTQYKAFWWFLFSYRCCFICFNVIVYSIKFQTIYTKHLWVDFTTFKPNNRVNYCKLKKMYLEKKSVSFHYNAKILSVLVCRAEFIFLVLIFIVIVFPKDILSWYNLLSTSLH